MGGSLFHIMVHTGWGGGAFSSLFSLPGRDLAPKFLTGLMLWSILQGGNSAPENELRP